MGDNDWLVQGGTGVNHNKFSKDKIAEIYKNQEIAVHSMTHPDLTKVPAGMVSYEIAECRKELEELVKHPVTGMAYPFAQTFFHRYDDKSDATPENLVARKMRMLILLFSHM